MTPLVLTMPLPGAPAQPMQYTPGPDLLPADAYKENVSPDSATAKLALLAVRATRSYLATGRNERRGASFACAYRYIARL